MSATYDIAYRSRPDLFGAAPEPLLAGLVEEENLRGRALDLGCGDGRNSIFLAQQSFDVHALDTSKAGVMRLSDIADSRNLSITAEVSDARGVESRKGCFELIVADTVLCHLDWDDAVKVAGSIRDLLRPGGWLYASTFTTDDPRQSEFAPVTQSYFDPRAFCRLFSGLSIRQCHQKRVTDTGHGPVHEHAIVWLVARRED